MNNKLHAIFMFWRDVARKYEKIKSNPEKSEKDTSLGEQSLVMSISGTILAVAFAFFAIKCFTWTWDASAAAAAAGVFVIIIGLICATTAVGGFVCGTLASILYAHYQRKLNNNIIGKIAFIVSILMTVGTIVTVIVFVVLFIVLV